MTLSAIKVTIVFIGLVHFRTPAPPATAGREVLLPLATSPARTYAGKKLHPHRADIVITGLDGGLTACKTLGGIWKSGTGRKPATCTVEGVSEKAITLPASTTPFDASGFRLPKLKELCPGISDLKPGLRHAASFAITAGTLQSCTHDGAWVSTLDLDSALGKLSIGTATVTLKDGAVVKIVNAPPVMPAHAEEEAHFWWYYTMYEGMTTCSALPAKAPAGSRCPPGIVAHGLHGASGVGCSNTDYP